MCTSRYAYQAPSSMLRARRKDANVRPNRWLDKKSSRGMLFENEELRLRTIEINAEVERGQGDIKKLKRQNEQLKREIWCLRDEYDKLEEQMRRMQVEGQAGWRSGEEEEEEEGEYEGEEGEELYEEGEEGEPDIKEEKQSSCGTEDADNRQNAHLASAKLLGLREQGAGCEDAPPGEPPPPEPAESPPTLVREPRDKPDLLVMQQCTQQQEDSVQRQDSIRRRTFHGNPSAGDLGEVAGCRLSLPAPGPMTEDLLTAADSPPDEQTAAAAAAAADTQAPEAPWWLDTPAARQCTTAEQDMPSAWYHDPSSSSSWLPQGLQDAQGVWAVTPYRGQQQQQGSPTFQGRFRRRAPPPPPPKPPVHEQVTVRRASSVLPDGTTRRSVTFHADSVTYIPPLAAPPPSAADIPSAPCPCGGAAEPSQHTQEAEGGEETRLLVRGLERVPGLAVRELIDALEQRLGGGEALRGAVRAVCLHHQARPAVAATVSVLGREAAHQLLSGGLEARGEPLSLEESPPPPRWVQPQGAPGDQQESRLMLVSGVTHQVSDSAVRAAVSRACGLRAGHVCRHVYKGVDTGERVVRVAPPDCEHPPLALRLAPLQPSIEPPPPLGEVGEDGKFRTHLSVQLRNPGAVSQASGSEPTTPRGPQPFPSPQSPLRPTVLQCNGPLTGPPPYTPPPPAPTRRPSVSVASNTRTEGEVEVQPSTPVANKPPTPQQRASNPLEGAAPGTPGSPAGAAGATPTRKKPSQQQNGGILRRAEDAHSPGRRVPKSRSVSVEGTDPLRPSPQRRRHGVVERPSSEQLLFENQSFGGSRGEELQRLTLPTGPALPWCACWGNGCI